ncbi:MAG: hypothetical protein CVT69_00850 [Actinobacteria bacterium HGW-Actinobacteria-9]|jgi:hypothetical protein|nr:MAG: hypothetical protein CVT69_00850 [Actinobacteria bacterium HGW-Actinobacteria-9]
MTANHDIPDADVLSADATQEDIQRKVAELIARREADGGGERTRRTRTILIVALVLLLLLLCAVGAILYRFLVPSSGGDGSGDGDLDTAGINWIRSIYGYGPSADQLFINPNDAATAPDGTIWVTDPGHARVLGFRGDGTFVGVIEGNIQTGEPFRLASRLSIDPDGIMYLVDRANETLTIMDGETKLVSQSIPGLTSVDTDDEIVVLGSNAGIAITDKDGNVQQVIGTRGSADGQFDGVGGVAIDSDERVIYAVDTYNNRLSAWSFEGERLWIVQTGNPANDVSLKGGSSLETTSSSPSALQLPTDVTIDGRGRPMVLDAFDFSISAFDPSNGEFLGKWGTHGDSDGQLMYPSGFEYDETKDWFTIADTQNLRAQIVMIDGTGAEGLAGVASWLNRLLAGPARALWPCLSLLPLILLVLILRRRKRIREEQEAEEALAPYTTEGAEVGL